MGVGIGSRDITFNLGVNFQCDLEHVTSSLYTCFLIQKTRDLELRISEVSFMVNTKLATNEINHNHYGGTPICLAVYKLQATFTSIKSLDT